MDRLSVENTGGKPTMTDKNCVNCNQPLIVVPCTGTFMEYSAFGTDESQCNNCGRFIPDTSVDGQTCNQPICANCQSPINEK